MERERLIAAVAGRVKLLEVTMGSPFVSSEQPDQTSKQLDQIGGRLVAYREYYTDMNYYKYTGEFLSCFVRMLRYPGLEFSLAHSYSLAVSKHSV